METPRESASAAARTNWRFWRRAHLYLGCFFAPLLILYTLTGWYQTFNTNRNKTPGEGETLVEKMVSIHVDQLYPSKEAESYSPRKFRILVAIMSAALLLTTLIGVVLAFQLIKRPWPVIVSLVLGILVPALLLWLGQRRN